MKPDSFFAGVAVGACVAFLAAREVQKKVQKNADNTAIKNAEGVAEQSRAASEDLMSQLKKHIESEQALAAECEELKTKVGEQAGEIDNLKNACAMQDGYNKKLEQEIADLRAK